MKYYHFTSESNYKEILKDGYMYPYKLDHDKLKCITDRNGIFVWKNKLLDESKVGTIIFQMGSKKTNEVVELELDLDDDGFKFNGEDTVSCSHTGDIHIGTDSGYQYHVEQATIYFKKIPVKNIKLIERYKLGDGFK